MLSGGSEDFIFREEAGQRRHARQRQRANHVDGEGRLHAPAQPAHQARFLRAERMQDRPGGEEQQRFEESVCDQVEHARRVSARTDRRDHEPQLADGRVSQHALDVELAHGNRGSQQRRRRTGRHDDGLGDRREVEQDVGTDNQVNARRDHCRGVDQRRDRRRTRHRVRQPDEQRDLRALAGHADEQQQRDRGDGRRADGEGRAGSAEDRPEIERAEGRRHQEQAEQQSGIADAVGDEGFARRIADLRAFALFVKPEADQQEGAQADAFPTGEQHHEVIRGDQHQHRGDEQVEVKEEAGETLVAVHVADGVDVDQRADAGDEQHHRHRKRVDLQRPVEAKPPT